MNIQLIAIDIDGTLLDDQHNLPPANELAIRHATAAGIQVVLATGRMRSSCLWLIERLALTTPGIFVSGLRIADHLGAALHSAHLQPAALARLLQFSDAHNLSLVGFSGDRVLTTRRDRYTDRIIDYNEPTPQIVAHLGDHAVAKLIILDEPQRIAALRGPLSEHMGQQANVLITQPEMLEIMPFETSKGRSLRWLCHHLNLSLAEVMAIGNAENDLEMMQMAGLGVAVANAPDHVRAVADVTVAANHEGGVAEAIRRFALAGRDDGQR